MFTCILDRLPIDVTNWRRILHISMEKTRYSVMRYTYILNRQAFRFHNEQQFNLHNIYCIIGFNSYIAEKGPAVSPQGKIGQGVPPRPDERSTYTLTIVYICRSISSHCKKPAQIANDNRCIITHNTVYG